MYTYVHICIQSRTHIHLNTQRHTQTHIWYILHNKDNHIVRQHFLHVSMIDDVINMIDDITLE